MITLRGDAVPFATKERRLRKKGAAALLLMLASNLTPQVQYVPLDGLSKLPLASVNMRHRLTPNFGVG